jgi:hypothetical protein
MSLLLHACQFLGGYVYILFQVSSFLRSAIASSHWTCEVTSPPICCNKCFFTLSLCDSVWISESVVKFQIFLVLEDSYSVLCGQLASELLVEGDYLYSSLQVSILPYGRAISPIMSTSRLERDEMLV